jgi:hypothetical protein
MTFKTSNNEYWTIDKGDWISAKYYDKQDLIRLERKRKIIIAASFLVYIVISAILIVFK